MSEHFQNQIDKIVVETGKNRSHKQKYMITHFPDLVQPLQ